VDERVQKRNKRKKLFATTKKIGYQINGRTTAPLLFQNAYFENLVSASGDAYQRELPKLGKPVDKSEWFTTPSTVTAYNNPNEIVFQQVFYSLLILIMRPMTLLTMEVSVVI
jgi:putative endopeptidase